MKQVIRLSSARYTFDEDTAGNCKIISRYLLPQSDVSPLKAAIMAAVSPMPELHAAVHLDIDRITHAVRGLRISIYHPATINEEKDGISSWHVDPYSDTPLGVAIHRWFDSEGLPLETTDPDVILYFFEYFAARIVGFDSYFAIIDD